MALEGTWNLTMNSPMGPRPVKAEFTTSGNAIGGNFVGDAGTSAVSGTLEGDAANFSSTVAGPMGQLELKFSGTVAGNSISGNVQFGAFGSGTFTGEKA
ncbi:MAG: hypothetical protein IT301_05615 [Dehalococcoidia bacterium]|nr:hypothetical protein [Dehalococcoidia bacterium]